jgi:DNA-binding CsgD family transcriptional regulator
MASRRHKPTRVELALREAEHMKLEARNTQIIIDLLGGKSHKQLAEDNGISPSTVRDIVRDTREQWKEWRVSHFDIMLLNELERINRIEDEAWDAYEKSKKPMTTTTRRTDGTRTMDEETGKEKLTIIYEEVKSQTRHPDPRYMNIIQWCVEQRLKIIGGYAPEKHAATTPDGKSPAPFTKVAFIKVIAPKERQEHYDIQTLPSGD